MSSSTTVLRRSWTGGGHSVAEARVNGFTPAPLT